MGFFDLFKKKNTATSLEAFPDMEKYRIYIFVKGGSASDLKARMNEYNEIYITETPFSMELYKMEDSSWHYVVLTLLPNTAEISPAWDYLNILLWLNEKAEHSFAYAFSEKEGGQPFYAEVDKNNPYGDSCVGIANGRNFFCNIPEQKVEWSASVSKQFDYEKYIYERYGVKFSTKGDRKI